MPFLYGMDCVVATHMCRSGSEVDGAKIHGCLRPQRPISYRNLATSGNPYTIWARICAATHFTCLLIDRDAIWLLKERTMEGQR